MSEQENENKEIEVVKGDGSELDFSPVYEHLNAATKCVPCFSNAFF